MLERALIPPIKLSFAAISCNFSFNGILFLNLSIRLWMVYSIINFFKGGDGFERTGDY
jgi:hypothetical protein